MCLLLSVAAMGHNIGPVQSHSLCSVLLSVVMTLVGPWAADQCLLTLPHPPGIILSLSSLVPTRYFIFIVRANYMLKFI